MSNLPPHEVTAHKVIDKRLSKSSRLYRTVAGLGVVAGVAAGAAAEADNTLATVTLITAGAIGAKVVTSKEQAATKEICDGTIKEIAYLNRKDVLEAYKSPYSSDWENCNKPNNKVRFITGTTFGSFLAISASGNNSTLNIEVLNGAPGVAIGTFVVGYAVGSLHATNKRNKQDYQTQLYNLSLIHDAPSIDR